MYFKYTLPSEQLTAAMIEDCMDVLRKKSTNMESALRRVIVSESSFAKHYCKFQDLKERMIRLQNAALENNKVTSDVEPGNFINAMLKSDARKYAFNRQRIVTALKGELRVINATVERIIEVERENLNSIDIKVRGVGFYKMTCDQLVRLIAEKLRMINNVRSAVTNSIVSDYLNEDITETFVIEMTDILEKYTHLLHKIAATC